MQKKRKRTTKLSDRAASPAALSVLRDTSAALSNLLDQVAQMRGMFPDEDGAIARAVSDGEEAIEASKKMLAGSSNCARCGKPVPESEAVKDTDSEGKTWAYCSTECRDKH